MTEDLRKVGAALASLSKKYPDDDDLLASGPSECVEPGYGDVVVVFSDLDDEIWREVEDAIEEAGGFLGFGDEWGHCDTCLGAFRTTHDSYSWEPSYLDWGDSATCSKCLNKETDRIEEYCEAIAGVKNMAIHESIFCLWVEREEVWAKLNEEDYEHGWHPHQNDHPEPLREALALKGIPGLFTIEGVGQFDVAWSLWVPKDRVTEAKTILGMEDDDE